MAERLTDGHIKCVRKCIVPRIWVVPNAGLGLDIPYLELNPSLCFPTVSQPRVRWQLLLISNLLFIIVFEQSKATLTERNNRSNDDCCIIQTTTVSCKRQLYHPNDSCIMQTTAVSSKRLLYHANDSCIIQTTAVSPKRVNAEYIFGSSFMKSEI
jgi:hypothetical protein